MGYRHTEQLIFPLKSISAVTSLPRFNATSAWAANTLVYRVTLALKAAFKRAECSSQGQRLNCPLSKSKSSVQFFLHELCLDEPYLKEMQIWALGAPVLEGLGQKSSVCIAHI